MPLSSHAKAEVWSGAQLGYLLFEELRERQALPESYEQAARYMNDIFEFEVDGHFQRVSDQLNINPEALPRRRKKQFGEAFRRSLSERLRGHFTAQGRRLGSGVSWTSIGVRTPPGSIAIEDLCGSAWIQLMAWAAFEAGEASKVLRSRGARENTSLRDLIRIDPETTMRLVEAHLAIGILPVDEQLNDLVPDEWMTRIQAAGEARFSVASGSVAQGGGRVDSRLADVKRDALLDLYAPRDTSRIHDPDVQVALRTKAVVAERLLAPLIDRDLVQPADVFDRIFLSLRLQHGATWDYERKELTGGPDSLELYSPALHFAVGFSPCILLSSQIAVGDPRGAIGLAQDRSLEEDWTLATQRRMEQVIWLLEYELL